MEKASRLKRVKNALLVLLLFCFNGLSSQTHFGVKGGYSLSQYKWGPVRFDAQSYFYAGGYVEQPLNKNWSVQAELLYTELGGSMKSYSEFVVTSSGLVSVDTITSQYRYPQLQIPVLFRYYAENDFSLSGGVNFGINLGARVEFSPSPAVAHPGKLEGVKAVNLFPFIGASYRAIDQLSVEVRGNFGFVNMHNSEFNVTDMFLQAGLAYRLR